MKPMKLVLAGTAAAVLAAFNPAFAGGAEESMTAPPLSEPSASASTSADVTAGANVGPSSSGTALGDSTAGAEPGRDAALEREQAQPAN